MIFTKKKPPGVAAESGPCSIREYLSARGIAVQSTAALDERYNNEALARFSKNLAELQLKGGDFFITYLRKCIVKKSTRCHFPLQAYTEGEQRACIDVANLLCSVGGLTNASLRNDGVLTGHFNLTSSKFISFVTGGFLEIAIYSQTKRILSEYSTSKSIDFEVLPNVVVSTPGGTHEYDILGRAGGYFFVIEVKSGYSEDFHRYTQNGIALGLPPDHQILVTSDRSKEEMEVISFFEGFVMANYGNFKEKLIEQLKNN